MRTLDSGTMGSDSGSGTFLGAMLVVTLGGIFVISALIGIINTGIQNRLDELRKGRSRVVESNHTVILGWNQQVFTIISELVGANANQRGRSIVVLADRDKVAMDDEIRARIPDTRGTKIVCRSRQPGRPRRDRHRRDPAVARDHRARAGGRRAGHRGHQDDPGDHQRPEPAAGAVPRRRRDPRPGQPRGRPARRPRRGRAHRGGRRGGPDHRPDVPPGRPVDRVWRAARLRRRRDLLQRAARRSRAGPSARRSWRSRTRRSSGIAQRRTACA